MFTITLILGSMCGVLFCYGMYGLINHIKDNKIFQNLF
jgi:hypothetical protein